MKFRRFLAALLGSLMIVSMMSFTANVSADGDDIIKLYVGENYAERGGGKQYKYDEATGIGYGRIWPNDTEANAAKSCYLNLSG